MYTAQADKVLLGRGKVFFDRFTSAGASTGLRFLGTVSKLEISTSDEKAKIYDYAKAAAPLLNEAVTRREITFAMSLHEYTKENLALVLMGEESAYTQTTGSITDEVLTTSVVKGRTYQTANRAISGITIEKSPATALVLGTDYDVVDATLGLIHIREGSVTVVDGDTILATYTKGTIASPGVNRIQAAKTSQIVGKLVFVADPAAGISYDLEAWKLSITPNGALGFITGDDFGGYDLDGVILADETNHPTEPYFRLTQRS